MVPVIDRYEKAEKGLSSLSTSGDRFAYWLSQISSPFVVGLGVLGYITLSTTSTVTEGLQWLTVIGVGLLLTSQDHSCFGETGFTSPRAVRQREQRLPGPVLRR